MTKRYYRIFDGVSFEERGIAPDQKSPSLANYKNPPVLTYYKEEHGTTIPAWCWTADYDSLKYAVRGGTLIMEESDTIAFEVKEGDKIIVQWTRKDGFLIGEEYATQVKYGWI